MVFILDISLLERLGLKIKSTGSIGCSLSLIPITFIYFKISSTVISLDTFSNPPDSLSGDNSAIFFF
jgi:hypothetical protein